MGKNLFVVTWPGKLPTFYQDDPALEGLIKLRASLSAGMEETDNTTTDCDVMNSKPAAKKKSNSKRKSDSKPAASTDRKKKSKSKRKSEPDDMDSKPAACEGEGDMMEVTNYLEI